MQRYVLLTVWLVLLAPVMRAQETPVTAAEKEEAEDRNRRLNARIENLEETIAAYQKRLMALTEELRNVREELAKVANNNHVNAATQHSLENLAETIKEVDRKRLADNEKVLKALEDIRKGVTDKPNSPVRPAPPPAGAGARTGNEKGYEYTVRSGDNPVVIASTLNKMGVKTTSKQVMDANPGVNWTKLRIGQKLFIPAPAP